MGLAEKRRALTKAERKLEIAREKLKARALEYERLLAKKKRIEDKEKWFQLTRKAESVLKRRKVAEMYNRRKRIRTGKLDSGSRDVENKLGQLYYLILGKR